MLAGDFNFPYVEWDTDNVAHVKGSNNSPGSNYIKLLNDEFLTQNVLEPTFRQANGETKNVLDYVISDIPDRNTELQIGPPLGNTAQAHLSITWEIKCNFHQVSKTNFKKFIFSKGNFSKLNKDISSTDWVSKLSNENTKKAYEIFTEEYKKLCELKVNSENNSKRYHTKGSLGNERNSKAIFFEKSPLAQKSSYTLEGQLTC